MRTVSLMILTVAAGTMLFAATNREATYTVGNLDGIHTGATGFVRVDDNTLSFRTGSTVVQTSYSNITSTELGSEGRHPVDVPRKRHGSKTVYQNLLVNFKDAEGKEQTMTLELTQPAAREIHNAVEQRKQALAKAPVTAPAAVATHKEKAAKPVVAKTEKAKPETAKAEKTKAKKAKAETAKSEAAKPEKVASAAPKTEAPEQRPEPKPAGWWGDEYWKTARNQSTWATQSAALNKR